MILLQQQMAVQVANPFLYETLKSMIGQQVAIQVTGMQVKQGVLRSVLPDHIVLMVFQTPFFIRMDEIVWATVLMSR